MSKVIELNVNETIKPNTINQVKLIASEQKEIATNQTIFNHHLKYYLDNVPIP